MVMTTSTVSAGPMTYYKRRSQSWRRSRLFLDKIGTREKLDRYSGQTLSTWRPIPAAAQTTALTEGTAPADITIATSTYTTTLQQWGAFVKISDLLEITGRSSMMDVCSKILGYNCAQTIDTVTLNVMLSSWTDIYVNNKTSATINAGDTMTAQQLRRMRKLFAAKNVANDDTNLYNLVLHPDVFYDLSIDDKVGSTLDVARRSVSGGDSQGIWNGEVTRFAGFRIMESANIPYTQSQSGVTVYQNVVAGADALLNVDTENMGFQLFAVPASEVNQANPLAQIGTVGWKATYAACDISDGVMGYIMESAVSEITY